MTGLVAGMGAKAALGGVGGFFKSIPRWAWIALAIASAALLGLLWHGHAIKKHDKALRVAVTAEIQAKTQKLIDGLNSKNAQLTATLRRKNDETARTIIHDAGTVRLSGPGKAQCRPSLPVAARGSQPTRGTSDVAVAEVPPGQGLDLIGLPFAATVDFAEQHDLNRAEVLAWRDWYKQIEKSWPH